MRLWPVPGRGIPEEVLGNCREGNASGARGDVQRSNQWLQTGKVIATDVSLYVQLTPLEQAYFTDQVMISAISQPGDSGSLVVDSEKRAVGLLFAGSERVTICNRIENVCRLLEINF